MTFNRDEGESDDDEDGGFRVKGRGKARDEEIVGFGEGGAERCVLQSLLHSYGCL